MSLIFDRKFSASFLFHLLSTELNLFFNNIVLRMKEEKDYELIKILYTCPINNKKYIFYISNEIFIKLKKDKELLQCQECTTYAIFEKNNFCCKNCFECEKCMQCEECLFYSPF